jgi:dinuclear metal center YbgI/SA1388 family protein
VSRIRAGTAPPSGVFLALPGSCRTPEHEEDPGSGSTGTGARLQSGTVAVPLRDVIAALDARYDPALAESWDAVGLVCGDPDEPVSRVLFAVDPTAAVVDEVIATGADLLVTHHPLLLTPVHGVPADDPKGRLVHRLVRAGAALFVAHTNADRAPDFGVNSALAAVLGLRDPVPLEPAEGDHRAGLGRVGELGEPITLRAFAGLAAAVLPEAVGGVRVAGDPERLVRRVAVCGGSGGSLLAAAAAAGADVLLTSDVKHHPASDAGESPGPALCDAAHYATEWPWLPVAAEVLRRDLGERVEVAVSRLRTDPWTHRAGQDAEASGEGSARR